MSDGVHPRIPSATYRLQFHSGFTFDHARSILDYLRALGISDIYAAPYFQASPGSTHGYDVADHNRLNPLIGDDAAFRAYCAELRGHEMGQVLDFVPNHMGIAESLNQWWMDVLEDGVASPYARYFDIDWRSAKEVLSDRILLPILGERYGKALENGDFKLRFEKGGFFLRYFDAKLPINPATYSAIFRAAFRELEAESLRKMHEGAAAFATLPADQARSKAKAEAKSWLQELSESNDGIATAIDHALRSLEGEPGNPSSFDALHELLDAQVYRLSYWRVAAEEVNYRRFFDINTLAGLRVEIPEVFEAAHQFVFELLARGDASGLRIDHVDGLWDPKAYLQRLQDRYAQLRALPRGELGLYLVVEKILDLTHESLRADWPVHGTTGYDFANQIVQVLTDPAAEKRMTKGFERFTGVRESFSDLVYEKKMLTMQISFSSEISALGKALDELSEMYRMYRDFTRNMLVVAVREVIACLPVYRTYTTGDGALSTDDERVVLRAILAAGRRNPSIEKAVLDFLRGVLLLQLPESLTAAQKDAHIRFVMKFQQCSGPVMAKGVEDTTFYIYNRLVALNEVGGNPEHFGLDLHEFHRLNALRAERWPHAMLGTSTHDTKRSEDVRMRIAALSEVPELWEKSLRRWSKLNKKHRAKVDDQAAPSRNEEFLLYQTLLGTWPLEPLNEHDRIAYIERIQQYMIKALKEAKVNSSWIEPNEEWEKATAAFVSSILDERRNSTFCTDLSTMAEVIARLGAMNSLVQTILKCTLPGVPDFYQGTEIWDLSLVDPDNRRPVDYSLRRRLLASVAEASPIQLMEEWKTGRIKLFLIQRLMGFRAEYRELFRSGIYREVAVTGDRASHVIAFERRWQKQRLLVVAPRLTFALGFSPVGQIWNENFLNFEEVATTRWQDLLTGKIVLSAQNELTLATVLSNLPFAVLQQVSSS